MAKVFTVNDIKNDISNVISQYVGVNDEDTAVTQRILTYAFTFPGIPEMITAGVLRVFENPELAPKLAEEEVKSFRRGMSETFHDERMIDACTAVYCELISDFCEV